ncbi:phage baseplate plug family protein [Paenibacillus melissococcoides]
MPLIVPVDEAGRETAVTWGNFGETVFLAYGEGEGEEDE